MFYFHQAYLSDTYNFLVAALTTLVFAIAGLLIRKIVLFCKDEDERSSINKNKLNNKFNKKDKARLQLMEYSQSIKNEKRSLLAQKAMLDKLFSMTMLSPKMMSAEIQSKFTENTGKDEPLTQEFEASIAVNIDDLLRIIPEERFMKSVITLSDEELLDLWFILTYYNNCINYYLGSTLNVMEKIIMLGNIGGSYDPKSLEAISGKVLKKYLDKVTKLIVKRKITPKILQPVTIDDNLSIKVDTQQLKKWLEFKTNLNKCATADVLLKEKSPVIKVYEDGNLTQNYCLETYKNENFTGKYFHIEVRCGKPGNINAPVLQFQGNITDKIEYRSNNAVINGTKKSSPASSDISYLSEILYLNCGGSCGKSMIEKTKGRDLYNKALRYRGFIISDRLIGVCSECRRSFVFKGINLPYTNDTPAYSDDGTDVLCVPISKFENEDKNTWSYKIDGKTFRYYNSFNCPHCGAPYIDYKKYPEMKENYPLGCVLLGKKLYEEKTETKQNS